MSSTGVDITTTNDFADFDRLRGDSSGGVRQAWPAGGIVPVRPGVLVVDRLGDLGSGVQPDRAVVADRVAVFDLAVEDVRDGLEAAVG